MGRIASIAICSILGFSIASARLLGTRGKGIQCPGGCEQATEAPPPAHPCDVVTPAPCPKLQVPGNPCQKPDPCSMDCPATFIEDKTSVKPLCWRRDRTFPPCDETWYILFCDPGCPCCQNYKSTWTSFASQALVAKVGVVDCSVDKHICEFYGIHDYPAVLSYHKKNWYRAPQGAVPSNDLKVWARRVVTEYAGDKEQIYKPKRMHDFNKNTLHHGFPTLGCAAEGGKKCIFPFTYTAGGVTTTHYGCANTSPSGGQESFYWCPTTVTNGVYVRGSGTWAKCTASCPRSFLQESRTDDEVDTAMLQAEPDAALADFNKPTLFDFMLHAMDTNATQPAGIGCPCGN